MLVSVMSLVLQWPSGNVTCFGERKKKNNPGIQILWSLVFDSGETLSCLYLCLVITETSVYFILCVWCRILYICRITGKNVLLNDARCARACESHFCYIHEEPGVEIQRLI